MQSDEGLQIEKLKGKENFQMWNFQITIVFKAHSLYEIVNGTKEKPTEQKDAASWDLSDAKAQKLIIMTIDKPSTLHIINCKTAKEMFEKLKITYQMNTEEQKCKLLQEFFNFSYNLNEDVSTHISKLQDITYRIQALDKETNITSEMLITKILTILPIKYKHFVTAWESTDGKSRTIENLTARLQAEEQRFNEENKCESETMAFKVVHNRKCYNCGSSNHLRKDCKKDFHQSRKFRDQCCWCKKTNHISKDCYFRKDTDKYKQSSKVTKTAFVAEETTLISQNCKNIKWIIDSGASSHMTNNLSILENVSKTKMQIKTAKSSESMEGISFGEVNTNNCMLTNVLYVPELTKNLLSVNAITKNGGIVEFRKETVSIAKGQTVLHGHKNENGLFEVNLENSSQQTAFTTFNKEHAVEWHRKMGHPSNSSLIKLIGMADGINITEEDISELQTKCETCIISKQTRLPFLTERTKAIRPLEIIHVDVCGPLEVLTWDKKKYFLTVLDDFTHFTQVYLLQTKSDVEEILKNCIKQSESKWNLKTHKIRCDNGGEFTSTSLRSWCYNRGILLDYSTTHTPQLNGKAERLNRTLTEKLRALLDDSKLKKDMWGEALQTAAYLLNRTPTSCTNTTPAEKWYLRKPDLSKIKLFGSKVYAKTPGHLKKLEDRGKPFIFIGYTLNGYRLWDPINKSIKISRDVIFINTPITSHEEEIKITFEPMDKIEKEGMDEKNGVTSEAEEPTTQKTEVEMTTTEKKTRVRKLPVKFNDYVLLTYEEAINGEEAREWQQAIEEEKNSLFENETWELTNSEDTKNKNILSSRWIFKIKEDGQHKARLVVRGCEQIHLIDYEDTFSPVISDSVIRLLFAICGNLNYKMKKFDIKTAFLYGNINEDIYMKIPEGFDDEGKICKLKKSLYGLKQAPLQWNIKFTEFLKQKGLVQLKTERCVFKTEDSSMFIAIYVDDGIIYSKTEKDITSILEELKREFKIKIFNEIDTFVGIHINETENSIKISQENFAKTVVERFYLTDAKISKIPMDTLNHNHSEVNTAFPYRQAIGNMLYLSNKTRPDISFSVSVQSRKVMKPTNQDVNNVKKIIKYIKGTASDGIIFKKNNNLTDMIAYCDADFAGDENTRKSTTGYVIYYADGPISWCSRLQPTVATSTTEAEFIAAAECCKELLYLKSVISELINVEVNINLLIDNQSTLALIRNGIFNKKRKHIDVKYQFICEQVSNGTIKINYCPTDINIADALTKPLKRNLFDNFKFKLVS